MYFTAAERKARLEAYIIIQKVNTSAYYATAYITTVKGFMRSASVTAVTVVNCKRNKKKFYEIDIVAMSLCQRNAHSNQIISFVIFSLPDARRGAIIRFKLGGRGKYSAIVLMQLQVTSYETIIRVTLSTKL